MTETAEPPRLHTYWRSSAAYRVRIALGLKGIAYDSVCWHLANGEHLGERYRAVAGFGLVPMLEIDGLRLQQSMAIIEYLEERTPNPRLLPEDRGQRARARALAQLIACEIHPINNLRVLKQLRQGFSAAEDAVGSWYRHWCDEGFRSFEAELASRDDGPFALGDQPSIVDCFLVPQVYNARRFNVDMTCYPRIVAAAAACEELPAFAAARPEAQPDAQKPQAPA
jgi:maleylacetoacetate isomerase